jgi:hypothetical protein
LIPPTAACANEHTNKKTIQKRDNPFLTYLYRPYEALKIPIVYTDGKKELSPPLPHNRVRQKSSTDWD